MDINSTCETTYNYPSLKPIIPDTEWLVYLLYIWLLDTLFCYFFQDTASRFHLNGKEPILLGSIMLLKKMLYSTLLLETAALIFLKTVRSDISLSPKTWPPNEFDRMETMTLNRFERPKLLAVSNGKGLVAGTTEPFAVHSGMNALRKGGTAMDACLATALAGTQKVGIFFIAP